MAKRTERLVAASVFLSLAMVADGLGGCTQSADVATQSGGTSGRGGSGAQGGTTSENTHVGGTLGTGGSKGSGDSRTMGSGGTVVKGGSGGVGTGGGNPASGGTGAAGQTGRDAATPDTRDAEREIRPTDAESPSGGRTGGVIGAGGRTGPGGTSGDGGATAAGGNPRTGGVTGAGGSTGSGGAVGPVTTTCPGAAPSGTTTAWCSCEQWGQWASGSLTYYNDIWGSGAGAQCIWTTASGAWGVAANHPNSSGIKSYPNVSLSPGKAISAITSYTSSFDVTVPSGGAYETAYDVWVKGSTSARIEIMLWMNSTGAVGPIASAYDASGKPVADKSNVTVGGHTWNVYFGSNGANDVVSFLRTSNTKTGTVDVKAILQWIIANATKYAVFTTAWTLDQVQFGYEITSDGSTQAFVTNSFSVNAT